MKRIIVCSLIVLACILSTAIIISARPTSSTIPAAENSRESVYNTDIVNEVFIDIRDYIKVQNGTSSVGVIPTSILEIDAGSSAGHAKAIGLNGLKTKTLYYDMNTRHGAHPIYTIETMVYPSATTSHWMRIIDNGNVIVYTSTYSGIPYLYAYNDTSSNLISTLQADATVVIYIDAFEDTYNIQVDTDGDGEVDDDKTNIDFAQDPERDWYFFGDRGSNDYGYLEWEYFKLRGHVSNDVKYFENFDDVNAENLDYFSENVGGAENPEGMYLTNWGDSILDNYCLEFLSSEGEKITRARTPWIDYVRDEEYSISLEFQIRTDEETDWFIILSDRDDILLYIDRPGGSGTPTYLYSYDGSDHQIMEIENQLRYYLEVNRDEDEYTVFVDLDDKGTYDILDTQTSTQLRFGDFSQNDCFDRVRIDSVMLRQSKNAGTDSDGDDITDDFEEEPFCPIFFDDFEYDLPAKEYGWQSVSLNAQANHEEIWEVGYPDDSTGDPDNGIAFGLEKDMDPLDERSRIYGTDIGGSYPQNMEVALKSPIIQIPEGGGTTYTYFTIKIFTWMWWDFENNVDGGIVRLEYWDQTGDAPYGASSMKLTPDGGYPNAQVSCFGNTSAYSGSSNKWVRQTFEVESYLLKGQYIRLVFETQSDNQGSSDWGWYLDDIKIYMSMVTSGGAATGDQDEDGDGLLDGVEFYIHGTSPMHHDSDFDGIADGMEVGDFCEFGEDFGGDPQVRNIFLEVDWLTYAGHYDHEPPEEILEEIQESFLDHDIWFFWDLDDEIARTVENEALSWDEFSDDFADPGLANSNTRFTFDRRNGWHYCLFSHRDDLNTSGYLGVGAMSHHGFTIFQGTCDLVGGYDDEWLAFLVSHELGHNLGLFDYASDDNYNGASPPGSTMDYDEDIDANPQPGYLDEESDDSFNCAVATRESDFGWEDNPWKYGGWRFSYVWGHEYRVNLVDGEFAGGLFFQSVTHFTW